MHAVIRQYAGPGAVELFKILADRSADVETLMRTVPGLISYAVAATDTGGFTVTLCQDRAGIDQSIQKAKDWVAKNAGGLKTAAPVVTVGDVSTYVK